MGWGSREVREGFSHQRERGRGARDPPASVLPPQKGLVLTPSLFRAVVAASTIQSAQEQPYWTDLRAPNASNSSLILPRAARAGDRPLFTGQLDWGDRRILGRQSGVIILQEESRL